MAYRQNTSGLPLGLEMALGTVTFERVWSFGFHTQWTLTLWRPRDVFQEDLRTHAISLASWNVSGSKELSKQGLGTGLPPQDLLSSHAQGHSMYLDALRFPIPRLKAMGFRILLCKVNQTVSQGTQEMLPPAGGSEVLFLRED